MLFVLDTLAISTNNGIGIWANGRGFRAINNSNLVDQTLI